MKKATLIILFLSVIYLSNIPNLQVSNPTTWINQSNYEKDKTYIQIFSINSEFYNLYNLSKVNKEFILHKLSHVFFYSILTYFLYTNISSYKRSKIITWIIITIFAFSDEIHQIYVIGRSGRFLDVLLDSMSSFLVLLFLLLYEKIMRR